MKSRLRKVFLFVLTLLLLTAGSKSGEVVNDAGLEDTGLDYIALSAGSIPGQRSDEIPGFSHPAGCYQREFSLELYCEQGSAIYYTRDGSDPAYSGTRIQYDAPIQIGDRKNDPNYVSLVNPLLFNGANNNYVKSTKQFVCSVNPPAVEDVDKCAVIRACAEDSEGSCSLTATAAYFIGTMADHIEGISESCSASGGPLAVISISMNYGDLFNPEYGIYVKGNKFDIALEELLLSGKKINGESARALDANYKGRGKEWERPAHIDFFETTGDLTERAFSQDCGIRIQGNYSRSDLQKGFRLIARSKYGNNNFDYAVFGDELKDDKGEVMDKFKTLVLRNGGNCAFTTKYSDTYWQSLVSDMKVDTLTSRPCIVYLNGEYWGLYVLQEDYSEDYFEDRHGVEKDDVVLYKGDAEVYEIGYKLDLGDLPEGETDVSYFFKDLLDFFGTHKDLKSDRDYEKFCMLVDEQSTLDYYAVELWINNKWDWPGKNWSMWRTINTAPDNEYADGRWRFVFYDLEFGGVSGASDARANTIKENNYKPYGMLDMDTENPSVLCFAYLMTNKSWRARFEQKLLSLCDTNFEHDKAAAALDKFRDTYYPLYAQFFRRYDNNGSPENSVNGGYASYKCIKDFLDKRSSYIDNQIAWAEDYFNN